MAKRKPWRDNLETEQDEASGHGYELAAPPEELPVVEEPVAESFPSESPPAPAEELSAIPLKVFVRLAGPKWDQMAGFLSYAKLQSMEPRTVPEWRATYQAFLRKPVR